MKKKITWSLVEVEKSKIRTNTMNPKTRDEAGMARLRKSLEKFGDVYDGILNADYSLIDGHSRLDATDKKSGMYFMPNRKLTDKEYIEMNAMFDYAKAGDTDFDIVLDVFDEDMLDDWNIETANINENPLTIEEIGEVLEPCEELGVGRDYLLIVFKDDIEYKEAVQKFGLKKVVMETYDKKELQLTGIQKVIKYENLHTIKE